MGDGPASPPYRHVQLEPVTPSIGAEVTGVDLAASLSEEVKTELKRALVEWKVLFFRDQHLDAEGHVGAARIWGEPDVHPFLDKGDRPEVVRLARGVDNPGVENVWHSDASFEIAPPMGAVLRAVDVPPVGGDTLWADMAAAYDGLPEAVKDEIDHRTAVHDFTHNFGRGLDAANLAEAHARHPAVEHPVVRRHPVTGRRILYVNRVFTTRIVDLPEPRSAELLELLYDRARYPEYQCRLRWRPDTVGVWDNRATQHYASVDYFPAPRIMERVTIKGDQPR